VAKNYRYYFGDLVLDQPVRTRNFTLKGYASLEDLSRYFEVDVTIIRRLNPSLRPPVFRGQKYVPDGYTLQLPQTADQARLDSFDETAPPFYKPQQKPSRYHRVRRGDTVGKIAKEHALRVSDLIIANNLNSRGTIYVNQNLRLPVPDEQPAAPPNVQKKVAPLGKKKPIRTLSEEEIPVPELQSNPLVVAGHLQVERVLNEEGNRVGIIRVEVEETLGHYAEWLGIPTQRIRWLNAFPYGRSLKLHERIRIPLKKVSKEQFEEARFEYHQKIQEDFFNAYKVETLRKYRVKNGDNIWTLCNETFNLPLWLIRKYNPGVNFGDLRWSQELAIPVVEEMTENQTETG
jgi:membrane-bound lytic murein transglycosylase D